MQKLLIAFVFCMMNMLFTQAQNNTNLIKTWKISFEAVYAQMTSEQQQAYDAETPANQEAIRLNLEKATIEFSADNSFKKLFSDGEEDLGQYQLSDNVLTITDSEENTYQYTVHSLSATELVLLTPSQKTVKYIPVN